MDGYVLNKFVTLIKVGQRRFLIKHGQLSRTSFVLDFEADQLARVALLDKLITDGRIDADELLGLQSDGGQANEVLELLLDEHVLVAPHSQDFTQYYALINERRLSGEPIKPSIIVASSPEVEHALSDGLRGVDLPYTMVTPNEFFASEGTPESLVVVYDRFDSADFHRFNQFAIEHNTPLVLGYLDGSTTIITPVVLHGETVCYNELEIQLEATLTHRPEYRAYKAVERASMAYPPFLLNQLTFFSLHLWLDFVLTGSLKTKNRALIFDTESLRFDLVDVLPLPVCPACRLDHAMSHDYL